MENNANNLLKENELKIIKRKDLTYGSCIGCVFRGLRGICLFPDANLKKCGTDGIYALAQKKIKFKI